MVFGLSSSKPLRLTSDHLPSGLIYHNQECTKAGTKEFLKFPGFLVS